MSLFGYLVERSLREPSAGMAMQRSQSRAQQEDAGPTLEPTHGAIRPRRTTRYERRPNFEPWLGETTVLAEDAEPSPRADEHLRPPEEQRDSRLAKQTNVTPTVRPSAVGSRPSGRSAGNPQERASAEPTPQAAAPVAAPPMPPPAAADKSMPPASKDVAVAAELGEPSAPPRERKPAAHPPAFTAAPVPRAGPSTHEGEAASPGRSNLPISQSSRPPLPTAEVEFAQAAPDETASAKRQEPHSPTVIRPHRAIDQPTPPARSTDQSARPVPPAGRPAVPSLQVSIGRVEVRAVYAAPPSTERRSPPAPAMSLDDYLKQRERS